MLNKKIKHGRIKPQAHKEPDFLRWLHEVKQPPCFICGGYNKIELHHIKRYSSDKRDDRHVIPLCGESCHRNGTELSAHSTPKKFRDKYPMSEQLKYAKELYEEYKAV